MAKTVRELKRVGGKSSRVTGNGSGGDNARPKEFSRSGRLRGVGAIVNRLCAVWHH